MTRRALACAAALAVASTACVAAPAAAYDSSYSLGCRLYFSHNPAGTQTTYTDTFTLTQSPAVPSAGRPVTVTVTGAQGPANGPVQIAANSETVVVDLAVTGIPAGIEAMSSFTVDNYPATTVAGGASNKLGPWSASGSYIAPAEGTPVTVALKSVEFSFGRHKPGYPSSADVYCTDAPTGDPSFDPYGNPVTSTTVLDSVTVGPATFAAPSAPLAPTAVAGVGQATVSWSAPFDLGGSAVNPYVVTAFVGSAASPAVPTRTCTTAALTCVVPGLTPGVGYTFEVTATNSTGTSPASARTTVVTPSAPIVAPGKVTRLAVAYKAPRVTVVAWRAPASLGGAALKRYDLRVTRVGGRVWGAWVSMGKATSFTLRGLLKGKAYKVEVRAVNAAGKVGAATQLALRPTK